MANCGYSNFTMYARNYYDMITTPWNGAYTGFTRLFMGVSMAQLASKGPQLRQGLRFAHDRGVAIELLMDGSAWVRSAAGVNTGISNCQQLRWFNGNATDPRDVFDGMHYDIEPHTLGPGWTTNTTGGSDRFNNMWQANLISIFRACQRVFQGTPTTLAWDVPDDYYYYVTDLWAPLVQDPYVDYVSIMNYHDSFEVMRSGIGGIGGVNNVLLSLRGAVPALFGAETADTTLAPDEISFWQEGVAPLEAALDALTAQYFGQSGSVAGFLGTAVHYNYAYGILPTNGFGTGPPIGGISCNTYRSFLFAYADDSIYVSMRVFRSTTNALLRIYDISNYVPGPWEMSVANAGVGPYRIELYDGPNGVKLTPTSPVPAAVCTVMAPT
jgi:hypothetical protein